MSCRSAWFFLSGFAGCNKVFRMNRMFYICAQCLNFKTLKMKRILLFGMIGTAAALSAFVPSTDAGKTIKTPAAQTAIWTADKAHTSVKFSVAHLVISDVDGNFKSFDGSMESSKPDFSDAKITFTADVNSINTDNEMRDNHLKSDDFLNAAKYPQMKFVSTSFTPQGDNKYKLVGNLTIRDVTKSVTFDVKYGGTVAHGRYTCRVQSDNKN